MGIEALVAQLKTIPDWRHGRALQHPAGFCHGSERLCAILGRWDWADHERYGVRDGQTFHRHSWFILSTVARLGDFSVPQRWL